MRMTLLLKKFVQNVRTERAGFALNLCCLAVAFFSVAAVITVLVNLGAAVRGTEGSYQVTVYLKETATPDRVRTLREALAAFPEVKEVGYVSAEAFRARFLATRAQRRDDFAQLDARVFPATLQVKLAPESAGAGTFAAVVKKLGRVDVVEDVGFHEGWMKRLSAFIRFVWLGFLVFGVLILLSSLFVLSNTIQLAFTKRTRAIEVMRLCGATNSFIELPYLLEGLLLGLAGGVLSVAAAGGAVALLRGQIAAHMGSLQGLSLAFIPPPAMVALVLVCGLTGMSGAYLASRRVLTT